MEDRASAADASRTEPSLPGEARLIDLPGRGRAFVRDVPGPRDDSPALVLLHGLAATGDLNWFTAYEDLSRWFRVLAVDQRGHGRGIRSRARFSLEDCADDAAAAAREVGARTVVPVGYSMGGPVAQLMWRRHRDLVAGMVLCATSRNFAGAGWERLLYSLMSPATAALRIAPAGPAASVLALLLTAPGGASPVAAWARTELALADPRALVEAARAVGIFTSHTWIREVDVPTAVVVTQRDQFVPPRRQLKLAQAISGASVWLVDGGHAACALSPGFVPTLVDACLDVSRRAG